MPSKNSKKIYAPHTFYHAYNRGVEKRDIFLDQKDYHVFLNLLKIYLSPLPEATDELNNLFPDKRNRIKKTFYQELELHAFCLMPNHFHLLIYQIEPHSMTEFIRAVSTSYAMYFNKKYKRVGSLFQGVYKAVSVDEDSYLLHLSRYIHRNPLVTGSDPVTMEKYPYSSMSNFLNPSQRPWITTNKILEYFDASANPGLSYKEFVYMIEEDLPGLSHITLENE